MQTMKKYIGLLAIAVIALGISGLLWSDQKPQVRGQMAAVQEALVPAAKDTKVKDTQALLTCMEAAKAEYNTSWANRGLLHADGSFYPEKSVRSELDAHLEVSQQNCMKTYGQ